MPEVGHRVVMLPHTTELEDAAMALSLITMPELVRAIEAQYDLRVTTVPRALRSGARSVAWQVTTTQGTWVAKISYPGHDAGAMLARFARVATYLNQQQLHAPRFARTHDGSVVGVLNHADGAYPVQLMAFEDLHPLEPARAPTAALQAMGALVAQLHTALAVYPEREHWLTNTQLSYNEWGLATEGSWEMLAEAAGKTLTQAEWDWICAVDQRAVAYLQQHDVDQATCTFALLHGDITFEHVQFLPDGSPYIFDFGDMCWGPVAHELAAWLQTSFRDSTLSLAQWDALKEQVIAGYASQRPLSTQDRAMIPVFVVNRIVRQAQYMVKLAQEQPTPLLWPVILRTYALADHVLAQSA